MSKESLPNRDLAVPSASSKAVVETASVGGVQPNSPAFSKKMSATPSTVITPVSLFKAFRRRQTLGFGLAILAVTICAPASWFLIPSSKYQAKARLQVVAHVPKVLFKTVETEGTGGDEYKRYQRTQVALVKSELVLNAALQDENVKKYQCIQEQFDPLTWLQEHLNVDFIDGSELMEIALAGENPVEVAGIVNAVKKTYMDEVVNVDNKRRDARHEKLKKLKDRYSELLKERRDTLRKLAETVGSDDRQTLAIKQQYSIEHAASVNKQHQEILSQKRQLEARLKVLRAKQDPEQLSDASIAESDLDRLIDADPAVNRLLVEVEHAEERLSTEGARVRSIARRSSEPAYKALQNMVLAKRKALANKREEVRPRIIHAYREEARHGSVDHSAELEQELAILKDIERSLAAELKALDVGNHNLNVKTLDLQSIQDDVAQMQDASVKIGSEVEALNVELEAPPRIRSIEDASIPRSRDEKKRFMMIGMMIFGSFFGSLFGVAFLELQSQKVDSADQVPDDLGIAVVGALPFLPQNLRTTTASQGQKRRYWHNVLRNSVDATRTMLLHAANSQAHQAVMIASAVSGEGKTSLATSRFGPMPSWVAISAPMATSSPVTIFTSRPSALVCAMVSLASGRGGSSRGRIPSIFQVLPSSPELATPSAR